VQWYRESLRLPRMSAGTLSGVGWSEGGGWNNWNRMDAFIHIICIVKSIACIFDYDDALTVCTPVFFLLGGKKIYPTLLPTCTPYSATRMNVSKYNRSTIKIRLLTLSIPASIPPYIYVGLHPQPRAHYHPSFGRLCQLSCH